jgi:hypothetical protein
LGFGLKPRRRSANLSPHPNQAERRRPLGLRSTPD